MPDLTPFIARWGYAAIFVIVILGNIGLPVPEETVLTVSGYLIWQDGSRRCPYSWPPLRARCSATISRTGSGGGMDGPR